MLRKNNFQILQKKSYGQKYFKELMSSTSIRKNFIDYFVNDNNHKFIRSSPVVPFCDPTVAFVNAGMNQFKSVFLGKTLPICERATNSQKCIRVGGKHNDLSIVGQDGYHHTFFEMLGNWSFGDYFKLEACDMALKLLTGPFNINKNRLYFTYFGGDNNLNIPPDIECREIWESLGIKSDRILPFGCKDNFWEMGPTGPCGPCTEIHIDHLTENNRSEFVNAGSSYLTELWNIVFIQYNRNNDGTIVQLPQKHIDTGMGFERLVAILQNKSSNYDTDLFTPIFDRIHKIANSPLYAGASFERNNIDTAYRIIADHARMITACLSDGMLPDQNQKLRRVLRTALLLAESTFKKENLLNEIIPIVVEILGPTYPEMYQKLNDTKEIISHEQEIFKTLRINSAKDFKEILSKNNSFDHIDVIDCPGFVPAYKDLIQQKKAFVNNTIPREFLYKLYDTYGLTEDAVKSLAELENLHLNKNALDLQINRTKEKAKLLLYKNHINQNKIDIAIAKLTSECPNTNDQYKYNYEYNNLIKQYVIEKTDAKIIGIIHKEITNSIKTNINDLFCIITDKSNFFYASGGQQSDKGTILFSAADGEFINFTVEDLLYINGNIVHIGKFDKPNFDIKIGESVEFNIDMQHRINNSNNHTATHILNASIRHLFKKVTYQISSSVTSEFLKIELGIIGQKITRDDISQIEKLIRQVIDSASPVTIAEVNSDKVVNNPDITLVPGEIYPETGLRLLTIKNEELNFVSNELCCGTHIHNTAHINHFCITNCKQTSRSRYVFTAITGDLAERTLKLAEVYCTGIDNLERDLKLEQDKYLLVDAELQKLRNTFLHTDIILPYVFKMDAIDKVNNILKKLKETSRTTLNEFIEFEMQNVLQQNPKKPFIIHFLDSSTLLESVPLQKATKLCPDRPVMVISLSDQMVKARCCVPLGKVTPKFCAANWLSVFAKIFEAKISPPKGQNPKVVCNMKAKKIVSSLFDDQLEVAIDEAKKYANEKM